MSSKSTLSPGAEIRIVRALAVVALAAGGTYVAAGILRGLVRGPILQGLCTGAQAMAAAAFLLLLPGAAIVAATRPVGRLSRFLVTAMFWSIGFGLAASIAIKLIWGSLSAYTVAGVWAAAVGVCLAAAKRRTPPPRLQNDLRGMGAKCLAGSAAIAAFVLAYAYPFGIDDDSYLPDDTYGRAARLQYDTTPDCRIAVQGCETAGRSAGLAVYRLTNQGARIRVDNSHAGPTHVNLRFFLRNRGRAECHVALSGLGREWASVRLLAAYDRLRHSRNYHKFRSNCDVIAARVAVPAGTTVLELRFGPSGAIGPVDMVSLSNLGAPEFMRRLEHMALLGDVADTRETYELSMSLVDRLFTHTVDYDEGSISAGGYTSVEPLLHHHFGSLVLALLGPSLSSLSWLYVAMLLLAYAACCMSVRRLAGRMGWGCALALAGVFMCYSTFVRPGVEGTGPDTFFIVLFVLAVFLFVAGHDSSAASADRGSMAAAIVLATLTQYYATPFVCLALCAHVALFRGLRRAAWVGLVTVGAALGVMALRAGVALGTGSGAAFWAELKDQNLARYFGLIKEVVFDGRLWLLPYIGLNYAHLCLAVLCASGLLPVLLPWVRRREALFYALAAGLIALFIGVPGFQRSHYVAPIVAPLAIAVALGVEAEPRRRRRAWLGAAAAVLAAVGLAVCVAAGRDYTGVFSGSSFWCRTGNMERSRYFAREGLDALCAGKMELADRHLFRSVLADPQPYSRGRAYAALAQGWLDAGRPDRAYTMGERAVQSDPDNVLGHIVLARALAKSGDVGRAESMVRRALDIDGRSVGANVEMAALLLDQGQVGSAQGYLRRAQAADPSHPLVAELQARVSSMAGKR